MRFFPAVSLLCIAFLGGCTSAVGPGARAGEQYIVNSQHTLFYSYGPAQSSGPDLALDHGARLTMLSYEYGYSHVAVVATGQSGYVATEDLVPAPPLPKQSPSPSLIRRRRKSDDFIPFKLEKQSQIPLPEFPESEPPPGSPPFRY